MEINLITDTASYARRVKKKQPIAIPVGFFADPRLAGPADPVAVDIAVYRQVLRKIDARFAPDETAGLVESHHAFSTPGRSYFDNRVLDALVKEGILDDGLITAVLSVDFTNPLYSAPRARLQRFIPPEANSAKELRKKLVAALRPAADEDAAAAELLANLTDPKRTIAWHRARVQAYLKRCAAAAKEVDTITDWWRLLAQRRAEVDAAETARHRAGRITEPGFKVLFPQVNLKAEPGKLALDPATGRVRE
jgi:hypothetical protein